MRSIEWWYFQRPWRTHNSVFKVTAFSKSNIGKKLLLHTNSKLYLTYGMVLCWRLWLTSKRVARVYQHQLSFLLWERKRHRREISRIFNIFDNIDVVTQSNAVAVPKSHVEPKWKLNGVESKSNGTCSHRVVDIAVQRTLETSFESKAGKYLVFKQFLKVFLKDFFRFLTYKCEHKILRPTSKDSAMWTPQIAMHIWISFALN